MIAVELFPRCAVVLHHAKGEALGMDASDKNHGLYAPPGSVSMMTASSQDPGTMTETSPAAAKRRILSREVPVVIDLGTRISKDPNRGNVVAIAAERITALTSAQAEIIAAEIAIRIKTRPAAMPVAAVPVPAWRP